MFNQISKNKIFFWSFVFLFIFFFHISHILSSDEGVVLNGAWNLINNKILYIDFFEYVPPGSFYLPFFVWKIFGVSYYSIKIFSIFLIFFSVVGVYKISKQINNNLNFLAPLIFVLFTPFWIAINHNTFSLFFTIWASYFLIKGLSDYLPRNFILTGLFSGISILFLQHKGLIFFGACFLFLFFVSIIKVNKEKLSNFLLYFLAAMLPLLLLLKWPINLLYNNLILFPMNGYLDVNNVSYYLFVVFLLVFGSIIYILRRNINKKILFLIFLQFFLFFSSLTRPDIFHVSISSFPLFCLLPIATERLTKENKNFKIIISVFFSSVIVVLTFYLTLFFGYYLAIFSTKEKPLITYIKENCVGDVYAGPFLPNIYFETRKLNQIPYSVLLSVFNSEEQFNESFEILSNRDVDCVITQHVMTEKFNYKFDNKIEKYISDNYEEVARYANAIVYKKAKTID